MKRQTYGKIIMWACNKHISNIESCAMKSIRDDSLKAAFVTMLNKLIFSNEILLKPYYTYIVSSDNDENVTRIQELQKELKSLSIRSDNLRKLRTQDMVDNIIFNRELNFIKKQEDVCRMEMLQCTNAESQGAVVMRETEKLIKFIEHTEILTAFDDNHFTDFVDKIIISDRRTAVFCLKCGLKLKEELQCMATK